MLLFFVRHGDPIYHPDSLTELGKLQADAVAKRLARYGMDEIYASTSVRARQTAQPLCDLLKKEAILLDWAHEEYAAADLTVKYPEGKRKWVFRDPEMRRLLNSEEIRRLGKQWYTHPAFAETNFARGMERIQRETDGFLLSVGYRHDPENHCYYAERDWDGRVAFFAHEGMGVAFLSCVLDIPYPIFATRALMTHSGVTVIRFEAARDGMVIPELMMFSNDSHIYAEGLPTKFRNEIYL